MDIYDYLKLDHQHVAELFKQFEGSQLAERRKQIAALIAQELIVHAHSEQETFYKALKQFESTKKEALHGQKEHKEIEDQINLILHSKEFGASWVKKVNKLKEIVDHHVNEEEGEIFKQAKTVLSQEDAYVIKEQMHYLKQHLLLSLKKQTSSNLVTLKNRINAKGTSIPSENKERKISPSETVQQRSSNKRMNSLITSKKVASKADSPVKKKTKNAPKQRIKKNESSSHTRLSH